jgi:dienelactone hydrolase
MKLNAEPFTCPSSRKALDKFREKALGALNDMLGSPPFKEQPPLNPRIMYFTNAGGYVRKKVRYGSETDDVVWAWLLVPKEAVPPVPAIICLPGSFMTPNYGKDGPAGLAGPLNPDHPEAYGEDFARLGYVVLCPDYPVAGERTTPGLKSYDTSVLDERFPTWTRVGLSAWDISRAVDFLLTVPEVDRERIGLTGWSQGGQMALLGAALEPRIAAAASVCGWSPLRGLPGQIVENLVQSYNYPRLRKYVEKNLPLPYDIDHFAALIAPRPFLDIRGIRDRYFPNKEEILHAYAEIAKIYELYGSGDCFKTVWFDGEHAHNAAAARETQAWFHRWFWETQ